MLQRNVQVLFKLTQGEQFRLVRTAQEAGMSVSAFIRKCCLTNERFTIINRELIRDVCKEMNRIGSNINQVARVANTLQHITVEQFDMLLDWQRELGRMIDTKLGGIKHR